MPGLYTRWCSLPAICQHLVVLEASPHSLKFCTTEDTDSFSRLVPIYDTEDDLLIIWFIYIVAHTMTQTCQRVVLTYMSSLCSKPLIWYLCVLSTDSEYHHEIGHSRQQGTKRARQGCVCCLNLYRPIHKSGSIEIVMQS